MSVKGNMNELKMFVLDLLKHESVSRGSLLNHTNCDKERLNAALYQLKQDGLISLTKKTAALKHSRAVLMVNSRVWNAQVFA